MTLPSNTVFNISVADPDAYKAALIAYLQTKPQYSGYNFTGSNWNVLLDLLSRNTYMRTFYNNMVFTEMFLDSAQLRDSVVSRSKELGYVPTSYISSSTTLNLTVNTNSLTSFTIPAGTRFNGLNSNGNFNFVTTQTISNTSSTGNYVFSNVNVYEGSLTTDLFVVDNTIENQLFTLTNPNIDMSSISVSVTTGANTVIYNSSTNVYGLNGNSTIYYVQATSNYQYQIFFGDGVLGMQPASGSVVSITYRICSGTDADGSTNFSLLDNLGAYNSGVVTGLSINAVSVSSGSANSESVNSIKFHAPRSYQTQQRGVVSSDYKSLIMTQFPSIGDVSVYGGGITSNAVLYGTVLISAVNLNGNPITQALKGQILQYIDALDIIHASTLMVDANTLFVDVSSNVHVNFNITSLSSSSLTAAVANTISTWSSNNIQRFNTPFRLSNLTTAINNTDPSIISNETTIIVKRAIPVTLNTNNNITFTFNNPIDTVASDIFNVNGTNAYLTDNVNNGVTGTIYQVLLNSSNNSINYTSIGSVNYTNGSVNIPNILISSFVSSNSAFYIYGAPSNQDIYGQSSDILKIDTVNGVSINILSS